MFGKNYDIVIIVVINSIVTNMMRRQVLLNQWLCIVQGILSVAEMLKEIQQKLKEKFPHPVSTTTLKRISSRS